MAILGSSRVPASGLAILPFLVGLRSASGLSSDYGLLSNPCSPS